MGFTGFPEAALDFYAELSHNNTREWWNEHRNIYRDAVDTPLRELAELLADEFGEAKIFRPYRDVRFSNDKSPLKTHQGMVIVPDDGPSLYLQLSADGLYLAGGWYEPTKTQLGLWRNAADTPELATAFDKEIARVRRAGYELMDAPLLKTAPRGWPRDHPRVDMLRRTNLAIGRAYEPAAWLHQKKCLDEVRKGWRLVQGWGEWLGKLPPARMDP